MSTKAEEWCWEKIKAGKLRFTESGELECYHDGRQHWYRKKELRHPTTGRAKYMVGSGGVRSSVYKNRLVWMVANWRPVPEGFVVDHVDGNRYNDQPDNLSLMTSRDSDVQGNGRGADTNLEVLGRWFEFVGAHGREPETIAELNWVEDGF